MVVVLLRHGEAEARDSAPSDADRVLTEQGRKRLQKALPALQKLIDSTSKVKVWTSPMTRAVQTAKLVAECLSTGPAAIHPELESGEFPDLIKAVRNLDPETVLILVGHEPILSSWSDRLCGLALPFKKGAAGAILLDPLDWALLSQEESLTRAHGQLLWFIQPKPMRAL